MAAIDIQGRFCPLVKRLFTKKFNVYDFNPIGLFSDS